MLIFLILPAGTDAKSQEAARSAAETFASLYDQYLPKVFRYISYRITDRDQAEDLTSAVFEKALTKYASYDPKKAAFSTWIFSIARNTLIDHYRGRSREQEYQKEEKYRVVVISSSPEEDVAKAEEVRKLRACLAKLGEREKEIITLKFGSGITNREIAKILGLSESNVGTLLCRAIRKLRDDFTGWQDG